MNRKSVLIITIALGIILLTEILVILFFPNLTFVNSTLIIVNRILTYLSFSGFILSILTYFKSTKFLLFPVGILLFLCFVINSCAEVYPIDTTTKPYDISILHTNEDGSKLIIRERINVKTNKSLRDTVLVIDKFVFRQIIKYKKHSTTRR